MTHLQTVSGDKWFFYQVLLITYNFSRCQMFWHFESWKQSIKLLSLCHSILWVGYYILFYLTFWCSGQTIERKMAQYLGCWWPCCVDYTQVTSDPYDNTLWMKCGGPGGSQRASVYILKVESFIYMIMISNTRHWCYTILLEKYWYTHTTCICSSWDKAWFKIVNTLLNSRRFLWTTIIGLNAWT